MEKVSREIEYERLDTILEESLEIISKLKLDVQTLSNENKVLGVLDELEKKIKKEKERLKELKNPLLLFVVGSGNYGKSTLINALIKDNIIKTTALPNTWKLDLFTRHEKEIMEITYLDNQVKRLTLNSGIKLLEEEEKKFYKSSKRISKKMQECKSYKNLSTKELKIYKKSLEDKYLYISDIIKTKYYLNKKGIIEDFIIVDTPGLNQVLSKSMYSSIEEYYTNSDGILWVIDSQNIVSKNTCELIDNINKLNKISNNKKKMILVVNKIDIIEEGNKESIKKIKEKVIEIYNEQFEDIVFISAKNAINGFIDNNFELIEKSNINKLFELIEKNFKENSEFEQINSKRKNLSLMSYSIESTIHQYKRDLFKEISKYNTISFEIENKMENSKSEIINLLLDIKNKSCYKQLDIYEIKNNIDYIENRANIAIEKEYDYISNKISSNKIYEKEFYKNKLNISKNKNIIFEYETLRKISQINSKLYPKDKSDEYELKCKAYKKIDILIKESIEEVNEKFENISNILEYHKVNNFKEKYIDYIIIKKHIKEIEKINDNIKKLR